MNRYPLSGVKATILVSIGIGLLFSGVNAVEKGRPPGLAKSYVRDSGQFDGNRIRDNLENNGMIVSQRITGQSGMEWPKGTFKLINYASGIWVAGKVGGDIRTAVGEYGPEFVPGPYGGDYNAPEHQLYIVNKGDLADPLASSDFQNWPADLGAPWVDEDGDGVYSPLPLGPDHPEFLGDQVIWYVMNDFDQAQHSIFNTLPLGIEMQMTIWGYDRPDAFGDMMFVKALIINKSGIDIDSTIIGLWADPDLGDAGDDFVGCDTTLGLGFCYNDGADADYGIAAPAIGYDFFQGPIVPSPGDTAFALGREIPDFKNLVMSSFTKYINGDPVYTDPNDAVEAYNYMSGFLRDGTPFVNSATGLPSMFVHPDDPNLNVDGNDDIWVDSDDHASGDRRFLMNAGPFTLAAGDTQEVVFGIVIAQGASALGSVAVLKEVDALAQLAYDIQFALPESPTAPNVSVTPLAESIVLNWDDGVNAVESYEANDIIDKMPVPVSFDTTWVTGIDFSLVYDTTTVGLGPGARDTLILVDTAFFFVQVVDKIDTSYQGEDTKFNFQGYNVYQLETATGQGAVKRVATFDLVDGIKEIFDVVFDPVRGENVNVRVQFGSDNGIRRSFFLEKDALGGGIPFKTNRAYYFAVTAYGYNPYGIPRTLESSMKILTIQPQVPTTQDPVAEPSVSDIAASHSAGASDGSVRAVVIDPLALTGDAYEVAFRMNDDGTTLVWDLTNTTTSTVLVSGNPIQGGLDMETGDEVGVGANPIIEGIQLLVSGPPNEFKDFIVTENADGVLATPARASAEWQGYPGVTDPAGDYPVDQTVDGAYWFIGPSSASNIAYEDFLGYVTRYAGGYGNPAGGIAYLIPDDFEFRFTAAGSKMLNRDTELVVDTPFEIWNIGDIADPADDFQLMGIFNDSDEDGKWNLYQDDSPMSGGSNDPYMEAFYVLEHKDRAPGSDGYDAMVAALTADPNASGVYIWATGPGLPLAVAGQITRVVLLNMTFISWNGGDVTASDWPADVIMVPEEGTVFRMVTTKPNASSDVFTFSTDSLAAAALALDMEAVNVWPNPYFAYNPEERTPVERMMQFTHLPGTATIRIFNLAGQLVKKIDHTDGTQFETWDLTNNFNIQVASGMYIASIESDQGSKILKLAVIQAEQRIDVY